MRLLEILVGLPKQVEWRGKSFETSIFKQPISTQSINVGKLNIEGDKQADPRFHGGPLKSIYAYDATAYVEWRTKLNRPELEYGSFGENLCISDLNEKEIAAGDLFEIGTVQLKAIQPRLPCQKLAVRLNDQGILKTFLAAGKPGIYFSVEKVGSFSKDDTVKCVERCSPRATIFELFEIYARKKVSASRKGELLINPHLIEDWIKTIQRVGAQE